MTKEKVIKSKYKVGQVVKYPAFAGKKFGLADCIIKYIYWFVNSKGNQILAVTIIEVGSTSSIFATEKSLDEYNK
jgi:hypothetical protein